MKFVTLKIKESDSSSGIELKPVCKIGGLG